MVSKSVRRAIALLTVATALLLPVRSHGQDATERETARGLMDDGREKFDAGDYEAALRAFRAADRIMNVTTTGLWSGKTLAKLGRLIEARDVLIKVSQLPQRQDESPVLAEARLQAAQLQSKIADQIGALEIAINGVEPGAKSNVWVDARQLSRDLLTHTYPVDPGWHVVVASSPGFTERQLRVKVGQGETVKVILVLEPTRSEDGGTAAKGPSGDEGHSDIHPLVWVGFSSAAAGVVVGAISGGLSLNAASSAKEGCVEQQCPAENSSIADRSVALAHVSTTSFAIAGAGAVLGVVGILLSGNSQPNKHAAGIQPLIGPGAIGLQGRF